jgi:hypothetical protein
MPAQTNLHRVRAVLAILLSLYAPSSLTQVYRWVDSSGRVHYGDIVPDRYKAGARLVDSRSSAPTSEQISEAKKRAERERLEAAQRERRAAAAPSIPPLPAQAGGTAPQSCEAEWKKFVASADCYAPYLLYRGGIRPGAVEKCGPAVATPTCGPLPANLTK